MRFHFLCVLFLKNKMKLVPRGKLTDLFRYIMEILTKIILVAIFEFNILQIVINFHLIQKFDCTQFTFSNN